MQDLDTLIQRLDPDAPLASRHLWLIGLLDWLRGDGQDLQGPSQRLGLLLDLLQARPALAERLRAWWKQLADTVDFTTLLADLGFAPRSAFLSELLDRLRRRWLPTSPDTTDAAELFQLCLRDPHDAQWIEAIDPALLPRLEALLTLPSDQPAVSRWQADLLEAITYCTSQIRATGFAPEVRLRLSRPAQAQRPFHALASDAEAFRQAWLAHGSPSPAVQAAAARVRERLDACRHAAASVYEHLETHGISVGLVFRLRQLRERALRIRALMDVLMSGQPAASAVALLASLARASHAGRSVRVLVASNSSLLAAKVAERSAETGEHYITRNRAEYLDMLRKAAGGGALMALTTWGKFAVFALGLSAFWGGFFAGMNYALSFIAVQLLHWTVATKQPAMTAPAMAARLHDLGDPQALERFVDEVTHLVRSQVAAVLGNLALVAPAVLVLNTALLWAHGVPMIDADKAAHTLHDLSLLGPTALFAAFTGVLLFASSIIAGWTENWFVLNRLDSALRWHPHTQRWLGPARAERWTRFLRDHISGFAANLSLGLMLGLVPAFAAFFGLGLEVRHVTLSTGQIAAAAASLGTDALAQAPLWWAVAAIPVTGALNVSVSFLLALRLAISARNIPAVDRGRVYRAIRARLRRRPREFFLPPRDATPNGGGHG